MEGIVTLEDLLEEIVGEIEDEFDLPHDAIERLDDHTVRISGVFPIDEFNEELGTKLSDEDYHTVAGIRLRLARPRRRGGRRGRARGHAVPRRRGRGDAHPDRDRHAARGRGPRGGRCGRASGRRGSRSYPGAMLKLRYLLVAATAAGALFAGATQAASHKVTKLYGQSGPGFTITLKRASFVPVRSLKRGHVHLRHPGPLDDPQLPPEGPRRRQEDVRSLPRHQDLGEREAEEGQVHVRVRPAQVEHARVVHRQVTGRSRSIVGA